jgi:hypothetical protein
MERREVLLGSATAAVAGLLYGRAEAAEAPPEIVAAVERFRASIPKNFSRDYVEHVVIPFFLTSFYEGERPLLPMIDVSFSKENALPSDLWGLIYEAWNPTPAEGVTVFLQGLEERGDNNLRKRVSAGAKIPHGSGRGVRLRRSKNPAAEGHCRKRQGPGDEGRGALCSGSLCGSD